MQTKCSETEGVAWIRTLPKHVKTKKQTTQFSITDIFELINFIIYTKLALSRTHHMMLKRATVSLSRFCYITLNPDYHYHQFIIYLN